MSTTIDPFDELAAMFLTSPPPVAPAAMPMHAQAPAPAVNPMLSPAYAATSSTTAMMEPQRPNAISRQASIELLLAGNLPVRGGLWLAPYADAVARAAGCVALVRLDGDEPTVQVLRPPQDFVSASIPPRFDEAIAFLAPAIDIWMIRPASGTPASEFIQAHIGRISLMCSADDAAIVAAYQTIKELAQASEQTEQPLPPSGVVIVGSDQPTAAAAAERLNRATVNFLGVHVRMAMCLPRIDSNIRSLRHLTFAGQEQPTLHDLKQWIEEAPKKTPVETTAPSKAASGADGASSATEAPKTERFVSGQRPTTASMSSAPRAPIQAADLRSAQVASSTERSSQVSHPEMGGGEVPIKLTPKPEMGVEPKQQRRPLEPDDRGRPLALASFVADLTPLPVRSPGHERIELALDISGRLHLLGREQTLREMRIVEAWAKAHREIIAMAYPQAHIDPAGKTVCHIFTAEPANVADLQGTDLRLHVLAPVVVDGKTGWYAAPLNAAAR